MDQTEAHRIRWDEGHLIDDAGAAVFRCAGGPVIGWALGEIVVDGTSPPVTSSAPTWEIDELSYGFACGPLRVSIRHTLDRTWTIRCSVINIGTDAVSVDRLRLVVTTGPGWTGWAVRAGAEASIAALPHRIADPVYGFTALQGEIRGCDEIVELGRIDLPAGGQHVVRLRGERFESAREFARGRHEVLPDWDWLDADDSCRLHHPDLAVHDRQDRSDADGTTELEGGPGERRRLVLAGAQGLVEVDIRFAPVLHDLVLRAVQLGEREWPKGRQGIMIPDAAAGLIVAQHLTADDGDGLPRDLWTDAVLGFCARIDAVEPSAFTVALVARMCVMLGERELAEQLGDVFAGLGTRPGAALIAPEVLTAQRLNGLAGELRLADGSPTPARAGEWLEHTIIQPQERRAAIHQVGAALGFGLRGARLGRRDLTEDAYLLAVCRRIAELDPPRPRGWACGFRELIEREERRIRFEIGEHLAEQSAPEALAWLLMS